MLSSSLSVGEKLKQWRLGRKLSLGALSLKSGVHKSTLSYWESQKRFPSENELNAVLKALNISSQESIDVWKGINAPRSIRSLSKEKNLSLTLTGKLLKAMRVRQHMTQEAIARKVGLSRAMIALWEGGESWPDTSHLHQLCYALNASEEEVIALTTGRFLGPSATLTRESWQQRFEDTVFHIGFQFPKDLLFLQLQADAEELTQQGINMRRSLIDLKTRYGYYLWLKGQPKLIEATMDNPIGSLLKESINPDAHSLGIIVYSYLAPNIKARVAILDLGIKIPNASNLRSWVWSEYAFSVFRAGDKEYGLKCMSIAYKQSLIHAELFGSGDSNIRKREWATLLFLNNQVQDALEMYPPYPYVALSYDVATRCFDELFWAEALYRIGDETEANTYLLCAKQRIEEYGLTYIKGRLKEVTKKLNFS